MAQWFQTEIRWVGTPPTESKLRRINELFQKLDYDAPAFTSEGLTESWRHPMLGLPLILNILHCFGYPCRGRQLLDAWPYEDEDFDVGVAIQGLAWVDSEPDLSLVTTQMDYDCLAGFSRTFGPYLPPQNTLKR